MHMRNVRKSVLQSAVAVANARVPAYEREASARHSSARVDDSHVRRMPTLLDALSGSRHAWSKLPGCEEAPRDPYSSEYLEKLFARLPKPRAPLRWERVLDAWQEAMEAPGGCNNDLILVSVRNHSIAAVACQNISKGSLAHFREFKFLLVYAPRGP